jgi:putative acetyltransferase
MLTIRPELPSDYPAISELHRRAFGGEFEARLVEGLRGTDGYIPGLSLVAVQDDVIAGHILFTVVHIRQGGRNAPILSLAPLAVLPEYQNQGIGSTLTWKGLQKCRELGYPAVVVLGHPDYYPRFGFGRASAKSLKLPFEAPDEACMVLELYDHALEGIQGMVEYPSQFFEE